MPTSFFADLVRELAQEGGTGPLTPTGAVPGHRRFADAVPPGVSFHYAVAGIARPEQWEAGIGRIGSDGRLLREKVAASSADGAAVDFAPGLKTIALTVGAGWFAARDAQAAMLAADVTAFGAELAGLADAVETKQPLSTTHPDEGDGEAADAVTVRRGAGWVNIPLSALAFRGADGRYALDGAVSASGLELTMPNAGAGKLFVEQAGSSSVKLRSSATLQYDVAAASSHQFFVNGVQVAQIGPVQALTATQLRAAAPSGTPPMILDAHTGSDNSARALQFHLGGTRWADMYVVSGGGGDFAIATGNGTPAERFRIRSSVIRPGADNIMSLGESGYRWSVVYAGTGTINTSDARDKAWRGAAGGAELRAARRIVGELGFYQWNDAIAAKGADGARMHFGARAQAVWAIMADEGLIEPITGDAAPSSRYAFLCHDQWDEGAAGEDRAAGDRFGIRTDQLALFLIAAQDARLAALEAAA